MELLSPPDIAYLLEAIPYPAMILTLALRIVSMNRLMEALTGYTQEKVSGVFGELVLRSNTGNSRGQLYARVLETGEGTSVTGDILTGYRRKVPIQYNISLLRNQIGEKCGLMVIAEDISNRETAAAAGGRDFSSIDLVGYSSKMQKVFSMIPLMAQTDASVLITGETGTGKDKIAEVVHQKSARARYPFIKVNCGALPLGLLESELFGHVKGAFTGAFRNKPGMFKLADKGTLFLTEIGDMPMPLQVKLLSVLDDRKFVPVGGEQTESVDVRIIAATHRPLRSQVQQGTFREDLFYRLNVLHVHLPPLRERESDTRSLLDHFLDKFTQGAGKHITGFSPAAIQTLMSYSYPGNIRELSNIVEYAVNICRRNKINKEHLPPYLFDKQPAEPVKPEPKEELFIAPPRYNDYGLPLPAKKNEDTESWSEIERRLIIDTLKKYGGNRTRTSASLGWGRMKLWRKMKNYHLLA